MARVLTSGFENNDTLDTRTAAMIDPLPRSGAAAVYTTARVRSGDRAGLCAGTLTLTKFFEWTYSQAASRTYWLRVHVYLEGLPETNNVRLIDWGALELRVKPSGVWALFNSGTQIGSDGPAVTLNDWQRVEVKIVLNASQQITAAEIQINGTSIFTQSGVTLTASGTIFIGQVDAVTSQASPVNWYLDDLALNDDLAGGTQTSWPGDGKVVECRPIADQTVGAGWQTGAGGTTGLFAALDNTPPVGVAEASATSTSQARCLATAFPADLDLELESYASKGIAPSDTISLVVLYTYAGEGADATGTKAGELRLLNNPAFLAATISSYGSSAVATHPSNWVTQKGVSYSPTVDVADTPSARLRVGSGTTATRMVHVEHVSLQVEYVPAPAAFIPQVVNVLT